MRIFRIYAAFVARSLALLAIYLSFAVAGFAYYGYRVIQGELPQNLEALRQPPSKATQVFARGGEKIGEFYLQNRIVASFEEIPPHVRNAFIAAEDSRFWEHPGYDAIGIVRAALANARGTGTRQGASTITQQLTRMLLLSQERTYYRKMKEVLLATRVEKELHKETILEMYLNRVYLGHGSYGVQAAALRYFGTSIANVSLAEAALLAGLVQRPSAYSPVRNLDLARKRQRYVLERMRMDGYIDREAEAEARAAPLALITKTRPINHLAAPHFVEHVRKWAQRALGTRRLYDGGLRIHTTLDAGMQASAEAAVRHGLEALDRRIGFRGPTGHLSPAEVAEARSQPPILATGDAAGIPIAGASTLLADIPYTGVVVELPKRGGVVIAVGAHTRPLTEDEANEVRAWADSETGEPLRLGDQLSVRAEDGVFTLAQRPDVEAALLAMEPKSGAIRAMVGGYDFNASQFNRATQAQRQIGSAFKPIIYATAMAQGRTHLDLVRDTPVAVPTAGGVWSPKNYDGKYLGSITLRTALAKSLNTVSVRLVLRAGVDAVIDMARSLGVVSPLPRHVSIALGTPDLRLIEIASVYAAFANGGKRIPTQDEHAALPGRFVDRVETDRGEVIADYRDTTPTRQAIPSSLAYLVVDLMKGVVERGTGKKAQALGWPTAAKTGTSTQWRDAWFVGYTNALLAGVWVGRDDFTPIGARATGGSAALPIWLQFMQAAHPPGPSEDFPVPTDIVLVRANELSGQPAGAANRRARLVPFARGTVPGSFLQAARRFGDP